MTQAAATLTQSDVARLMGTLGYTNIRSMILAFGQEVAAGRLSWAPARGGGTDTFGPRLAGLARQGSTLTRPHVNSARTGLLQRNWRQVVDLLTRDVVVVTDAVLGRIRGRAAPAPQSRPVSRPARRRRRSSRVRAARPAVAPAPTQPTLCGREAWGVTCTLVAGHRDACIGDNQGRDQRPTNDVDSVLARRSGMSVTATLTRTTPDPADAEDAQFQRFALVIEAAWDDLPVASAPEPEGVDPSVERFRLLDLDD